MRETYVAATLACCALVVGLHGACTDEPDTTTSPTTGTTGTTSTGTCDPSDMCEPTDPGARAEGISHSSGAIPCTENSQCCVVWAIDEAPVAFLVPAADTDTVRELFDRAYEGACNCNTAGCIDPELIAFCGEDGFCHACELEPSVDAYGVHDFCGDSTMDRSQCYDPNAGGGGQGTGGQNAGGQSAGGAGGGASGGSDGVGGGGGGRGGEGSGAAGGQPSTDPVTFGCLTF